MTEKNLMIDVIRKGEYSEFENGESGLTKLIKYGGNRYVLRKFKSKRESDKMHKICKKLERFDILPKLYYRKGNDFVFEFVPGKECEKPPENLNIVKQVAKICAIVNKLKVGSKKNLDENFGKALNILLNKKKINKKQLTVLKETYSKMKKRISPQIALEVWDVHQGNFIFYKKKVYFVDIGGIKVDYKGLGIIKSFSWFKTEKQRTIFRKAYDSITSIKYMDKDHINFLNFYYSIISISERILKNKSWGSGSKERLKKAFNYTITNK